MLSAEVQLVHISWGPHPLIGLLPCLLIPYTLRTPHSRRLARIWGSFAAIFDVFSLGKLGSSWYIGAPYNSREKQWKPHGGSISGRQPNLQTFALRSQGCNSMEGDCWRVATCGHLWFAAWTRVLFVTAKWCPQMVSFWILLVPGLLRVVNYRDISKPMPPKIPTKRMWAWRPTALVPGSSTFTFAGESWSQPRLHVLGRFCSVPAQSGNWKCQCFTVLFICLSYLWHWYSFNILQYIIVRRCKVQLFREAQVSIQVS